MSFKRQSRIAKAFNLQKNDHITTKNDFPAV